MAGKMMAKRPMVSSSSTSIWPVINFLFRYFFILLYLSYYPVSVNGDSSFYVVGYVFY